MRKFIKLIIFFSIIIGFYSCVFDPAPRGLYIKLKSENIDEIESVFVSGDTLFADQNLINEYNSDKFYYEHYVPLYNSFFKVKVVLKDSTVLYSETIHYEFQKYAYYISITKKGIVFEKNYKNYITKHATHLFIIIVLSLIFKILIFVFNFNIKNKGIYVLKYTFINVIYIYSIFYVFDFVNILSFFGLISVLTLPFVIDYTIHYFDKNINKFNIWLLLIVNILFYFILTYPILMLFLFF